MRGFVSCAISGGIKFVSVGQNAARGNVPGIVRFSRFPQDLKEPLHGFVRFLRDFVGLCGFCPFPARFRRPVHGFVRFPRDFVGLCAVSSVSASILTPFPAQNASFVGGGGGGGGRGSSMTRQALRQSHAKRYL